MVFQGKPLKTHQNMAVKLEALLLLIFSRFYFYLAWALVNPLLVHSERFASRGLVLNKSRKKCLGSHLFSALDPRKVRHFRHMFHHVITSMTRAKKVQKQILGRINVWNIFRNLSEPHAMHGVGHFKRKAPNKTGFSTVTLGNNHWKRDFGAKIARKEGRKLTTASSMPTLTFSWRRPGYFLVGSPWPLWNLFISRLVVARLT